VVLVRKYINLCIVFVFFSLVISGCALVKPTRQLDEVTPIDWGLGESFEHAVTIYPFDARDEKWGVYAAQRMKEYLLEKRGFRRIIFSDKEPAETPYEIRGELEYLFYGGTHSPSRVCITVRVIDTTDGDTRFMRISRASSEKKAFHMTWLSRVYVPSPYPEELLNSLLAHVAGDIARRTRLPAKKCP
jgi:hypothetical protein